MSPLLFIKINQIKPVPLRIYIVYYYQQSKRNDPGGQDDK